MLDPWTLRVMVEVAERGSFSAAAEALSLTQPAVSRQIGGLERRLGVSLFRRVPRGVRPTAAGRIAVEQARDILARLRALEARLGTFTSLESGHLRMSAYSSANTSFMPEVIHRFSRAHPGVGVTLVQPGPAGPLAALRDDRVDLALITAWSLYADLEAARTAISPEPLDPSELDGLDLVPLLDEEFHVALPADHPLARHRRVRLSDLREETWIEGGHPDCLGPIPNWRTPWAAHRASDSSARTGTASRPWSPAAPASCSSPPWPRTAPTPASCCAPPPRHSPAAASTPPPRPHPSASLR
jgi:DNA-binding transcriptional LysR family regulator